MMEAFSKNDSRGAEAADELKVIVLLLLPLQLLLLQLLLLQLLLLQLRGLLVVLLQWLLLQLLVLQLLVRLAAAEAAAAASKEQQQLQLDLAKAQLEKQMEGALSTLKEQLQIRDREANFYRKAIEDGAEQTRREQRLLASVLAEIGLRYHKVRCYCQQLKQEHEALILRLEAGGGPKEEEEIDDEAEETAAREETADAAAGTQQEPS
ncbi:hypothetical protein Emed_002158 [Eimeria media]